MKKFIYYLVFIVWLVISLAWIKLIFYNQLPIEFRFAELGFSWNLGQPAARFLSAFFAASWLAGVAFKRQLGWTGIFSWLGLIVLTQIIFNQVSHANYADPLIFPLFKPFWLRCTIYFTALLFWFISSPFINRLKFISKNRYSVVGVAALSVFAVLFFVRPVYVEDYREMNEPIPADVHQQLSRVTGQTDFGKPVYLFYFSLGCEHCYMMYHRLAAGAVAEQPKYQARIIFSGPKDGLQDFLGNTHIPFPAKQVLGKQFYLESGPQVPAIYRFEKGKCSGYWLGDGFNFYMLNYLSKQ